MLIDHHDHGRNRPGRINGYVPDLFASDLPTTFEVIGEAKTPNDLETLRSARQIAAFLDHLALRPRSSFYLCVRSFSVARAKTIVRGIVRPEHALINITVLAGV